MTYLLRLSGGELVLFPHRTIKEASGKAIELLNGSPKDTSSVEVVLLKNGEFNSVVGWARRFAPGEAPKWNRMPRGKKAFK